MNEQLKQTSRKEARIKMALIGVSGSGKSLSSLLIARGLCDENMSKVAVIDSENSIELYSHIGDFMVLNLQPPYSSEKYINAIEACEQAGMDVIIIDSISHCWNYLLQLHGKLSGNSFTNWNKVTPLHNSFVEKILQSKCHIICTVRSKQDYLIQVKEGKTSIEKVGLKAIQRNEIEYEFTLVLNINIRHQAKASKDRTGLFMDKSEFIITEETGRQIKEWCSSGIKIDDIRNRIREVNTIEELNVIYNQHFDWYQFLSVDLINKKKELLQTSKEKVDNN